MRCSRHQGWWSEDIPFLFDVTATDASERLVLRSGLCQCGQGGRILVVAKAIEIRFTLDMLVCGSLMATALKAAFR